MLWKLNYQRPLLYSKDQLKVHKFSKMFLNPPSRIILSILLRQTHKKLSTAANLFVFNILFSNALFVASFICLFFDLFSDLPFNEDVSWFWTNFWPTFLVHGWCTIGHCRSYSNSPLPAKWVPQTAGPRNSIFVGAKWFTIGSYASVNSGSCCY